MTISHSSASTDQAMDWSEHVIRCQQSGLSIKAYCRANELIYDTFLYHFHKTYPATKKTKLIPVTLTDSDAKMTGRVLCRLELRDGHSLSIHDE